MGLVADLVAYRARSTGLAEPASWFVDFIGGGTSLAGARVTPDTALGITAVWNAVRIISSAEASLPCILYRRTANGGKERATDHRLYRLLHDQPNSHQTRFEFFEMLAGHLELRGNGFAVIAFDRRGIITSLTPLHPDRVTIYVAPDGTLWYEHQRKTGGKVTYREEEILHLRGFSSDGIVGHSPITVVRESLGTTLAAEAHAASFYGNSATPGGILKTPNKLSKESFERLKDSWRARHAGAANAWKPAILEEGLDWTQIGMSSRDAQFIENRRFQVEEVARIFDIPPHKLKHLERSTFSNIEHQGLEFLQDTIRPRMVRLEQRLNAALLLEREREEGYFIEFLMDAIARADLKTRYDAYAVGRQWGWLSADDVRARENMNPLPDGAGAEYLNPLNMIPAGAERAPAAKPAIAPTAPSQSEEDGADDENVRSRVGGRGTTAIADAFRPLLVDAVRRAVRKEVTAARRQADRGGDASALVAWYEGFWAEHTRTLEVNLAPIVRTLLTLTAPWREDDALVPTIVARMIAREQDLAGVAFVAAAARGPDAVRALLDAWDATRAEHMIQRELPSLTLLLSSRGATDEAAA